MNAEALNGKLSTKIIGALLGFLLLALVAIGSTLFLSWQLQGSAAAINDTGSLRMRSYRLALRLSEVADPTRQAAAREAIAQDVRGIETTLQQLRTGDPQRPLYLPPEADIQRNFRQIETRWQQRLRPLIQQVVAPDPATPRLEWHAYGAQADQFVAAVNTLVQLIEQDSEQRTFWLRCSQLALVAMALIATISFIYLMFLLIIEPVTRLQDGMHRMKEKDFAVRLAIHSDDEFGRLALGFNEMADRLQSVYGNLEQLVRNKTEILEQQNRELALLYDSAAFLQRPQTVETMCAGFLRRISAYFCADGSSVRILDASRNNLHIVVHEGLSREMVETEHCLKVGECLCGEAAAKKITIVRDLRRIDPAHQLQCNRDGFKAVAIFHIYAHQQYLGFFNLHFRQPKRFNKREEALLETLGQLLGTAIENLRLATREREMAISEERNLVAQGLHDSIAQSLNFLNLQVQMMDASLQDNKFDEVAEIVPALRAGVQESYEDVRELLHNFRSRLDEGDLLVSLESTIEKFRRQTGIAAHLSADLNGAPFPREQQLQILFIVQEALSNIRKHAHATKVEVRIADKQDFTLTIEDNGVGFDELKVVADSDAHVGIHIMRERAQRIDASLLVESARGRGTSVQLNLPQAQRRAA